MGKKNNKKRKDDDDDWESEMLAEAAGASAPPDADAGTDADADRTNEANKGTNAKETESAKKTAVKVDPPKPSPSDNGDDDDDVSDDNDDGDGTPRLLTKKEKERLKKEKEKAKKAAKKARQREAEKAEKRAAADEAGDETSEATAGKTATEKEKNDGKAEDNSGGEDSDNDGDDADGDASASSKKKKKKKKNKDAAGGDAPKKKPSALGKMLKAKLEAEKLAQEERQRELDELERIAQEKQRARDEAARLEQEKKDAKKQKEKERKERLRAEGKLLTKAQREKQRLAELKRKQMLESGMMVAGDTEEKKKPVYSKRKQQHDKQKDGGEEDEDDNEYNEEEEDNDGDDAQEPEATKTDSGAAETKPEEEDESENVKEDWEMSSDDEEDDVGKDEEKGVNEEVKEPEKKPEPPKPELVKSAPKAAAKKGKRGVSAQAMSAAEDLGFTEDTMVDVTSAAATYGGVAVGEMRSPICVVMGHVDTGKTKILDKIRRSHVQDGEAGGITQQIGASFFPIEEVKKQTAKATFDFKVPGLLIMDTPGHESFSNLRDRGSSLCNMAILVVDIMHGLEPQTIESINMLRKKKCPFVVALNKVDRIIDWKETKNGAIQQCLKKQKEHTKQQFEILTERAKLGLNEQGFNCELYYENKDFKSNLSIVPTSAHTGEGIPDLLFLVVKLCQTVLTKQITFTNVLNCTVMEVKKIDGHGTTIDVILADGTLKEGDTIVLAGLEGPIVTQIRSLLMPEPLKELRVKNAYRHFKSVPAANGVKIAAKDLEKAVAGLPLVVAKEGDDIEALCEDMNVEKALEGLKTVDKGVHVQASTLGSMEALLEFLRTSKIPVSGLSIGPVHRKDITRCSIQLERDPKYAMVLAFDVPVEREAQGEADRLGIKIFTANIIYHLFDAFTKHMDDERARLRAMHAATATFPCRLTIMPECIFNKRDPIVLGVKIVEGQLKPGTPLTVPTKEFCDIGVVTSLEFDNEPVELAKAGQEVCIKIDAAGGDKKYFGRHFDETDELVSRVSRKSIDAVKDYFKEDLTKADWRLMLKFKALFEIL